MSHNFQLTEIATIRPGYPIRSAVRNTPNGEVPVVQIRNVAESGVDWPSVVRTTLTGLRDPDELHTGDILFAARGQRNVAVCLDQPPPKAVCSPHFFLIRMNDQAVVLPQFIAWQMNLPKAQQYLAESATGSYIKSIRRDVLEKLSIHLPTIERQRQLVGLARAAQKEKQILEQLIENRRRELEAIAGELLAHPNS